jgi:hypothetical protein
LSWDESWGESVIPGVSRWISSIGKGSGWTGSNPVVNFAELEKTGSEAG